MDGWEPAEDFLAMLRQLPTRQRVAAALFYQADLSIYEISRVMGISGALTRYNLSVAEAPIAW